MNYFEGIEEFEKPDARRVLSWLLETDEKKLEALWNAANLVRQRSVGDEVHLRGLAEASNFCSRNCAYCGIRAANKSIKRYRMTEEEILFCAKTAVNLGYGTLVMQTGEDPGLTCGFIANVIHRIKSETPLAVTLSLGERDENELKEWKAAGADRYLLRFETSDRTLFEKIHPPLPGKKSDRLSILNMLKKIGFETGSGVMIGIPGQRFSSLTNDIVLFGELDLDMIGVGPFVPHPATPLGTTSNGLLENQVPATPQMTYKVLALSRLVCPQANIPSTTALATLGGKNARMLGLERGANVVMPNLTPAGYRAMYEIYPDKASFIETREGFESDFRNTLKAMGRKAGTGPGNRRNKFT